jgi:hypothetical protein
MKHLRPFRDSYLSIEREGGFGTTFSYRSSLPEQRDRDGNEHLKGRTAMNWEQRLNDLDYAAVVLGTVVGACVIIVIAGTLARLVIA